MILNTLDQNCQYLMDIQKVDWQCRITGDEKRCISFELKNTSDVRKGNEIPEETTFIMSFEDAMYLKSYLEVALMESEKKSM